VPKEDRVLLRPRFCPGIGGKNIPGLVCRAFSANSGNGKCAGVDSAAVFCWLLATPSLGCVGPIPRTNVSIKISSLSARSDPIDTEGAIRDLMSRLVPILEVARNRGVLIKLYKDN
jgi:hypothetical protein